MAGNAKGSKKTSGRVSGIDAGRVRGDGSPGYHPVWVVAHTGEEDGSDIRFSVSRELSDLWDEAVKEASRVVAIDMPLGLLEESDFRVCENEARAKLGRSKKGVVFMSPPRWLIDASDAEKGRWERDTRHADPQGRRVRLLERCEQVRAVVTPEQCEDNARPRAVEVHAEVCFWAINDGRPVETDKRTEDGREERLRLLKEPFPNVREALKVALRMPGAAHDYDYLDAAAIAWTARRVSRGPGKELGDGSPDPDGYPMSIWY